MKEHDKTMDAIEHGLADMTAWERDAASSSNAAWEAAWESEHPSTKRHTGGRLTRPLPSRWLIGAASAVLILLVFVGVLLPSLGKARSVPDGGGYETYAKLGAGQAAEAQAESDGHIAMYALAAPSASDAADAGVSGGENVVATQRRMAAKSESSLADSAAVRHVIRTAHIDLKADDVQGVFNQIPTVLDQTTGEYIENSSLSGEDEQAVGQLTLRVQPGRLDAVLASLRGMGEVVSETAAADDVTEQAVDLDARLQNEQRVETELQELLASRTNAGLDEILKLRESLRQVRERIEVLTAQRDRLGRQVALASVAVSIRSAASPAVQQGFGPYFSNEVGSSWRIGLHNLVESLAWLIRVAVGGLVWWLVLIAAGAGALVYRRRAAEALRVGIEGVPRE